MSLYQVAKNDEWNLQIQVNSHPDTATLQEFSPNTVSGPVWVPRTAPMTPEEIRKAFMEGINFKKKKKGKWG